MNDELVAQIAEDFQTSRGLSWLVRSLLSIGRQARSEREQLKFLEVLQAMIGSTGRNTELIEAIEDVKRAMGEYQALEVESDILLPPHIKEFLERFSEPGLTERELEALKQEAARKLLGASASPDAADGLRGILERLADPLNSPEERAVLKALVIDRLTRTPR